MEVRPGCKRTEVGLIPEDWDVKRIADFTNCVAGGTPSTFVPSYWGGSIKWMSSGELHLKRVEDVAERITEHGLVNSAATVIPPNCVLIGLAGQGKTRGTVAINLVELTTNQSIGAVLPSPDHVSEYLFYNLDSRYSELRDLSSGGGGRGGLNLTLIGSISIPLPSIAEQIAIAKTLSDVDALLTGLDRLIAKKRDIKQAAMQQLLTGQTRLPGFQGEWEVKQLGDVATFHKGRGLPKSALTPYGAEPCIHYGELFTHYPEAIETICSRTDDSAGAFRSAANDVLMPTSDVTPRGLAKASCVQVDGVILGGDILVIRCDSKLVFGAFLSYTIRHQEVQILQLVTGTTVFHLYGRDMAKLMLSLPSVEEQIAIVTALTDMAFELTALEARRDKTRALKKGMMQELLTGKTRLVKPEAANV